MKKILLLLMVVLVFGITACSQEDDIIFDLVLGDTVQIDVNENFIDPGYIAKHDAEDISEFVTVTGTVDITKTGSYTLTYTLLYNEKEYVKTRTVIVGLFNSNCGVIEDTDLQVCNYVWTQYLNTVVKLSIYLPQETTINTDTIFEEIESILSYYTIMADKYKSYDGIMNVYEINQQAGTTVTLDERLFELIEFTFVNQEPVEAQFNAALGPVLQIWHNYREDCINSNVCHVPATTLLNDADQYTNPELVVLDSENLTLTMEENMSIDLGGVSKGFVSGKIIEYLDQFDLHGYLLNNGESNISIGGEHPVRDNKQFIIAVTDPTGATPYYATVYLKDGDQLVTSGDYQKYYTVDDQNYHHIISPTSLFPEYYSRSVSIITSDPALADLYSTAIFNMSIEDGQAFVNSMDNLEAIWYGIDGTIYFSENFETEYLIDTFE